MMNVVFQTVGKVVVGTIVIGATAVAAGLIGGVVGAYVVLDDDTKKDIQDAVQRQAEQ